MHAHSLSLIRRRPRRFEFVVRVVRIELRWDRTAAIDYAKQESLSAGWHELQGTVGRAVGHGELLAPRLPFGVLRWLSNLMMTPNPFDRMRLYCELAR